MFNLIHRVMAQEPGSIVQCGPPDANGNYPNGNYTGPCDIDQFFILIHTLIKYAIYLSGLAVTVAIVYAAFMYLISAGEMEKLNKAKGAVKAAVIGLVIVLTGWLLINTLLQIFGVCPNWNVFDTSRVCQP